MNHQRQPALPPNGGLLNRQWRYVPAANTDIRATFARVKEQQREAK